MTSSHTAETTIISTTLVANGSGSSTSIGGLGVDAGAGDEVAGALAAVPRHRLRDERSIDLAGQRLGDPPRGATGPRAPHHDADGTHDADADQQAEHRRRPCRRRRGRPRSGARSRGR